ncbi:MAG TPA: ATP-dependent Clp protease adaptor ClpS [Ignavibacteriales bacterium]|nr:ATP-dependent Clp protease adaptor ClpS [Ignavibacteriales bacterium]HPD67788.1 ATP-dependent Clp protease adaptor ClpS [Ignavibacteriales bacterium]HPP33168.1 ATP-dependent Clp protease adaptor ClpS [Ignavibacteriales bacterium]HRR17844.1 ATP-dependent Clp protease adaptor ClpS [Ignavibacteriales bacterium]HRT99338.1 ATP-dependent Clp protease adaptor ClpS [Ignavibacteriales bacterium]
MTENKPTIEKQVETIDNTKLSLPFSVILFNDDFHTFDEVILQLMKATQCSFKEAEAKTLEAHNKGKAKVYHGELSKCLNVSSILEEIALRTQVVSEDI